MWRFLVPYSRFKDWFSSPYVVVDMELVFHVMVWRVMGEGGGVLRWIVSFCVVFVLMGCIIVSRLGGVTFLAPPSSITVLTVVTAVHHHVTRNVIS